MRSSLALALFTSLTALAGTPEAPAAADAEKVVQKVLVKPLAAKDSERARFSRAKMPASARRVRVLDEAPQRDEAGKAFFTFAVDTRGAFADDDDEGSWRKDAVVGCVYPEAAQVFVVRGERHYPAAFLLGKKAPVAEASVCRPAGTLAQR